MTADKPFPLNVSFLVSLLLHAGLFGNIWAAQRSKSDPPLSFPDVWDATPVEVWNEAQDTGSPAAQPAQVAPTPAAAEDPAGDAPSGPAQPESQPEAAPRAAPPEREAPTPEREAPTPEREAPAPVRKTSPPARPLAEDASTKRGAAAAASGAASERAKSTLAAEPQASSSAAEATPGSGSASGSAVGMVGLPAGMRHFAKAFARALPAGCFADPGWLDLPLGPVGRARFAVHIDEAGRIESVELDPELAPPSIVRRMIDRAILLLKSGTFSLDAARVSAGVEWLELSVSLSQTEAHSDSVGEGRHLRAEGHETPTWQRPGRGYFTLNSGLHMEASLRLLRR